VADRPDDVPDEVPGEALPDLEPVQTSYLAALEDALALWLDFTAAQTEVILDAVQAAAAAGDVLSLLNISVSSHDAAATLERAMINLGADAAAQVVREAQGQGMDEGEVMAATPDRLRMASAAQVYAAMTGRFLVSSAVGEAMRVWSRGRSGTDVRDDVGEHMGTLTDAYPRLVLGGALGHAQRDGRVATIMGGPEAALYADEVLDKNTCEPCRSINRKWIGNASDPMPPTVYPVAGYVRCKGRWRCRGMVVAIWRGGSDWRKWIERPGQRTSG
jgi:hypothetical protein